MSQPTVYSLTDYPSRIVSVMRKNGSHARLHWHDCCEMELVLSGHGIHTINGREYPLRPGDLYLFTPADCHSIRAETPYEVIGIMFDGERLSDELYGEVLALESTVPALLVNLADPVTSVVRGYFETVLREENSQSHRFAPQYVNRLLDCILIELLHSLENPRENPSPTFAREAILYLHRHYAEPITLDGMAGRFHLNASYFSSLFRQTTGHTFKSYLVSLRLRNACRLLVNTDLSVTDICFSCGFESYSHFMRTFKAHHQISPLQFRRRHSAGQTPGGKDILP